MSFVHDWYQVDIPLSNYYRTWRPDHRIVIIPLLVPQWGSTHWVQNHDVASWNYTTDFYDDCSNDDDADSSRVIISFSHSDVPVVVDDAMRGRSWMRLWRFDGMVLQWSIVDVVVVEPPLDWSNDHTRFANQYCDIAVVVLRPQSRVSISHSDTVVLTRVFDVYGNTNRYQYWR